MSVLSGCGASRASPTRISVVLMGYMARRPFFRCFSFSSYMSMACPVLDLRLVGTGVHFARGTC